MSLRKKIQPIVLGVMLTGATSSFADIHSVGFESGEHVAAGDNVTLSFAAGEPAKQGYKLHLPNGLQMSYGEIVSMGDFYEVLGKPISSPSFDAERQAAFIAAFNTMATNPASVAEMPKILKIIKAEQDAVNDGMKRGEKPEDVYARIVGDDDRQWNCATGGSCTSTWFLKPGRYLQLAKDDFDHFGANAVLAYYAGHQAALKTAIAAHAKKDTQQLELAYAMNAYAGHFLSDHFAAGHLRTPRVELPNSVTPRDVGSILVSDMHNEENQTGLHVHNLRGDHWIAYGDRYYFDEANKTNRLLLNEALQKSADEVFTAYQTGVMPTHDDALDIIPEPDEIKNLGTQDIAPLFYWDAAGKKLYRRNDVYNLYGRQWTAHWWGWSTALLLAKKNPLSVAQQAELMQGTSGEKALQDGLITDKNIVSLMQKK